MDDRAVVPTDLNRLILLLAVLVSAIGAFDAAIGRTWDLVVVFVLGAALQLALLIRLQFGRPAVPLRSDLVGWLRQRAAEHGEPMEALADRCVAAARADLERV
jgi:hypothetical protein